MKRCKLSKLIAVTLFTSGLVMTGSVLAAGGAIATTELQRTGPDLHQLWDSNCLTCHGHSADFSRNFLKVVNGQLQGPLHKENFRLFLQNHYLAGKEVDSVYSMLLAEASTEPRYKEECSTCHKSAVEFVRESLTMHDGVLYSRKSEAPVHDYLDTHRSLNGEDVEFFMKLFTRVAHEVYRP